MAVLHLLIRASCASPPPSGQTCDDTIGFGPIPDWVFLVVLGVIAIVVVAAVIAARQRRRP